MRVLFLNQVFYPDVAATAQHAYDLARHLAAEGHEVVAIASRSVYGSAGAHLPPREDVDGIEIHRVGMSLFGKATILGRLVDFGLFCLAAAARCVAIRRPDVVVCLTTPPFIALLGWCLRVTRRCRFVYWAMDLYPDVAVACGVLRRRSPVTRVFEALNRFCLRRADRVVVLGRCMRDRVLAKGIDPGRVQLIGVWSDQDEVKPQPRSSNPYRAEWSVGDRVVVMYSGNFGLAHDVETMCEAAKTLRDDDRLRFAFVGGGKRHAEVASFIERHRLENAVLAPYQPRDALDASLSCGDIHLATMREGAEGCIVPCKLFGSMAASRPTIFVGSPESELALVLAEHDIGFTVPPGDVDGLVRTIRTLATDEEMRRTMGERARDVLHHRYARSRACRAWTDLLEAVVCEAGRTEGIERCDGP